MAKDNPALFLVSSIGSAQVSLDKSGGLQGCVLSEVSGEKSLFLPFPVLEDACILYPPGTGGSSPSQATIPLVLCNSQEKMIPF